LFLWDSRATPLGAWLDIASSKQGGRALLAQDGLARKKCGSGLASRCAARAALDLIGAEMVSTNTFNRRRKYHGKHLPQPQKM
ncbi:hypothetical protein P3W49_06465, partial [Pseudomonas putida]|uniref:hypothetical protein n=1 Tax=Pseudomonas putida TaxID=303 RepID=UPI0023E45E7D